MNLKPLEDRIVVKPGEAEEKTASGLLIPDTAKEKPQQGEVLAVGPGRIGDESRWTLPSVTPSCTRSTAEPKSRSTARMSSSFRPATYLPFSATEEFPYVKDPEV